MDSIPGVRIKNVDWLSGAQKSKLSDYGLNYVDDFYKALIGSPTRMMSCLNLTENGYMDAIINAEANLTPEFVQYANKVEIGKKAKKQSELEVVVNGFLKGVDVYADLVLPKKESIKTMSRDMAGELVKLYKIG